MPPYNFTFKGSGLGPTIKTIVWDKTAPLFSFLSLVVLWVKSRIRYELSYPPLVQLRAPSSGPAAVPQSAATINVLRSEKRSQYISLCSGRELFLLSCIFHRSVLLGGQNPSGWMALWSGSVCGTVSVEEHTPHTDLAYCCSSYSL